MSLDRSAENENNPIRIRHGLLPDKWTVHFEDGLWAVIDGKRLLSFESEKDAWVAVDLSNVTVQALRDLGEIK